MPKYHHAIFDLIGAMPVPSPERLAALKARERECGARFPASVRDFYAVDEAETLFREASADALVALEKLGDPADTAQGWLRVADENQGVVAWFVRLDAGDDPPVVNNNDEWPEDLSTVDWQKDSQTWTNFIFDRLAGYSFDCSGADLFLAAHDSWPSDLLLAELREELKEGPPTDAPAIKVRRFCDKMRLLTVRMEFGNMEAEWKLKARTPEALASLARQVWGFGTLSLALTAESTSATRRAQGEAVLMSLRASL